MNAPNAPVQLHIESFRSVRIEMVYCQEGPDTDCNTVQDCIEMAHGSAFIYRLEGKNYLVTARHNVTGRHWQTNELLSDKFTVNPTHLRVAFFTAPPEEWSFSVTEDNPRTVQFRVLLRRRLVPLIGEDWNPVWKQNAQFGADMDVAVVPFDAPNDVIIRSWERTGPLTGPEDVPWPYLSPGQDVLIIGYPYALSVGPLLPLWIRGMVASDPPFGYQVGEKGYPCWLVDARTRGGNSGAPVIRYRPPGTYVMRNNNMPAITTVPNSDVVGVYAGRTSKESDLGFVWPIEDVDDICRSGLRGTVS
ncbi:serine protease [Mycobacterium marinum]|uniref:trypsin-like peptidase domain-containing protein n=1 Tax=Mycobacterium marinum TaxID=1781 RepID=UPI00235967C0|nr:trypsin-like peptidase domain-containing protein [Mycobacterium marinum]WCS20135.1 serine protease [Mycobacterium marinum]